LSENELLQTRIEKVKLEAELDAIKAQLDHAIGQAQEWQKEAVKLAAIVINTERDQLAEELRIRGEKPEGREGIVTVYDSMTGAYLGCLGRETWDQMLLKPE
jgi:hypothetical protein